MWDKRRAIIGGVSWSGFAVLTGYLMTLASQPWILIVTSVALTSVLAGVIICWLPLAPAVLKARGVWFLRGAAAALILGLLISGPMRRVRRTLTAPSWSQLLASSSGCGTVRRCELQVRGQDATGHLVSGKFRVFAQRDGGLVVDDGDQHWWVSPQSSSQDWPHLIPAHYNLSLGEPILTRTLELPVDGLSVYEVGTSLWDALDDAPDPLAVGPELRWEVGDVRISGELTLDTAKVPAKFVSNPRLRFEGNKLIVDYAAFTDLTNSELQMKIERGTMRVTLPYAIPEPNLKLNNIMTIFRSWARQ